ncbi:polycystin-2-like isoform X2 [Lineus longissimus]|uniref:polycystin-2-like isoform X2 n=1 Tax=Lineus longissimus TaxID=88925 RepID=UPI00315DAEDE
MSNRPTSSQRLSNSDELEMDRMSNKNRPSSAASRRAWGLDDGGIDNPAGPRPDSRQSYGNESFRGDSDQPAAMESEMYVDGAIRVMDDRQDQNIVVTEEPEGCWYKFKRGLRSLWATRQTEETKGNRELHVKTTLRELVVYFIFLIVLCILTFGMTSSTMFYYTKVMSELFLDTSFPDTKNTFRGLTTMHDFWRFAESPLMDGLYWEKWYNGKNVTNDELGYIFYENRLLGVPRIRQLKVRNDSCTVPEDFSNEIKECFDSYATSVEATEPFGPPQFHNLTAWSFTSEAKLKGSSHEGMMATYSGAGYYEDLTRFRDSSLAKIITLKENLWLDRGSRVVFVDFTVYNANINLFCVIRILVEFPPTGGALPSHVFRTVKLLRYVTPKDFFVLACECLFTLFIIYYIIEEAIEIKKHRLGYFKSVWNILDIIVIVISIICIIFNIYRTIKVSEILTQLLKEPEQYADFEFLSFWQIQFNNAVAIAVFCSWVKVFKYISFNKTMTQLSSTLARCAKDLAGFAVMFFIIFFAFAQLGYLIFGTQVRDFNSFPSAVFTLFRIILGDFNFHELESANRVLGPIYFMLYVFFVFFVLLNMFLAIINDTYSEVKADIAEQKNEFEMADYFKKGYNKMLDKLNLKRDKIVDIQKALQSADINHDKQLDFEEWRQDLKTRGYADTEIEAVFAKYDLDGDRVLDEDEQRKMQADLEGQKAELNKEFENLDTTEKRPQTAQKRTASRISLEDSGDETDDEDSGTKSTRSGRAISGVSYEEFTVLSRRVDRMEHSIGSIVSKIDAVLVKLEAMEKAKLKRRETMGKILDSITESDGTSDEVKREQMERLVREELERWDSETSIGQASARGGSPSGSSGRGGLRPRSSSSRPGSGSGGGQNPAEV